MPENRVHRAVIRHRRSVALLAMGVTLMLPAAAGAAAGGGLRQLGGGKGCLSDGAGQPSTCTDVRAMTDIGQGALSPDGLNLYVPSRGRSALAVFDRDPATGALTQKTGALGCYTGNTTTATEDTCTLIAGTTNVLSAVAVSPDGTRVYASAAGGVVITFSRSTGGDLTRVGSSLGTGGVVAAMTVSPDDATLYTSVLNEPGGLVGVFRITDSAPGVAYDSCYASASTGYGCTLVTDGYVDEPGELLVTPDNKQLLLANGDNTGTDYSSGSIVGFDRTTAGPEQGRLASPTTTSCISAGALPACQMVPGYSFMRGLAATSDGTRIYGAGLYGMLGVQRNPATNALSPAGGCFSYQSSGLACESLGPPGSVAPAQDVVLTGDGENAYLGTAGSNPTVYAFEAGAGGALSLLAAPFRCLSSDGGLPCGALDGGGEAITTVLASPQGRSVYATGTDRVLSFVRDRPPVCRDVSASVPFNMAAPVGLDCSDPDGDAITFQAVTGPAKGSLGSVQGSSVMYGPLLGTSGTDTFTYRATAAGAQSDPATATVTVAGPAAPAATPPPSGSTPADKTPPAASATIRRQKLGKVTKSRTLLIAVKTNEPGLIVAQAAIDARLAKKLKLPANGQVFTSAKARPAIVGTGRATAPKPGTYTLRLKLTRAAKKKLAKVKRVKLSIRVRVADTAGNRRLVKKTVTLKR